MYDPRDYEPEEDDYVRPPDSVVCERLLGGDSNEYMPVPTWSPDTEDHDVEEEYMKQVMRSIEDEYAMEQIQRFERNERETHFAESKKLFTRLSSIDKPNTDIYASVLSMIALYEEDPRLCPPMTATDYERFADILAKTRLPNEERERWTKLVSI